MSYSIEGATGPWEVVIGLEVHAQVISKAKLFSGAATVFGEEPNTQVSFVDAAFPGMLPVLNRECVAQAVRTGLGLKAQINLVSRFDRKNYFYADLPAGYQISQYQYPIVGTGIIEIELADGSTKPIGVTRLHLEQDAGKSLHDQHPTKTYIDLNRCGVALMEIVSEPDLRSPEEAGAYLRKLRTILRYLGTCDGNMEEGSMRADVNVSVRKAGEPSAPAARSRTSTPSASSCTPSRPRQSGRCRFGRRAARSGRRRCCSTRRVVRRAACAARRMPTTTVISPIPTCCRWCWTRRGWRA
jgi:aspartyl-tRNA(Asn)/glutamyl-tRNA(Gln) amidotransferase subunit B